ncbi:MAG: hypothetical protein AAF495_19260 [Pseudomonadota bacterium]
MTRTVHLNAANCPEDESKVSICDRSLLFANSIFHFGGHSIAEAKRHRAEVGLPARLTT